MFTVVLDYLSVSQGKLSHSTSVSLRFDHFLFFFFYLMQFCFTTLCKILLLSLNFLCDQQCKQVFLATLSSGHSATALDEEYFSAYFLATSKEWLFSGFSYLAQHSLILYNLSVSVNTCSTLQIAVGCNSVIGCVDYKTG